MQERPSIHYMEKFLENLRFGPIDDWIGGLLEKLADEDSKALAMLPNGMCWYVLERREVSGPL